MTDLLPAPRAVEVSAEGLLQRVAVIAPHPDDEVLGAGCLIQRAVASGGDVRVIFVTDGEANPWPLRAVVHRWRIDDGMLHRWGAIRRREAVSSLRTLGVPESNVSFLSFPDQGLLPIASGMLPEALYRALRDYGPTLIVAPSKFDLHIDHRAVSRAIHSVVATKKLRPRPQLLTYLVHGSVARERVLTLMTATPTELQQKQKAILEHRTQLLLSRKRFMRQSCLPETLLAPEYDVDTVESRTRRGFRALRRVLGILGLW